MTEFSDRTLPGSVASSGLDTPDAAADRKTRGAELTERTEATMRTPGTPAFEHLFDTATTRTDIKSKSIRGGIFAFSAEGASLVLNMAVTLVLARILVPADFGLLGMVFAITALADRFKDLGLSAAIIQKAEINHSQASNVFWINAILGIGIFLIVMLMSGPIATFYHEPRVRNIAIVVSSTFIFSGLAAQYQALLRRRLQFGALAVIGVGSQVLSGALAIVLAIRGYGYWALVWKEVSRNVLVAAATWALCPWVPALPDRKTDVMPLIRFGRDVTLFNLITFLARGVDQILLGRFAGAAQLGVYRQAFQLISVPTTQLTYPVENVAEPTLSMLRKDVAKYRRAFRKAVTGLSLTTMPLAGFVFVHSREIIIVMLGTRWLAANDVLRILAVAAFVRPVIRAMGVVMVTCGKTARYATLGLLDSVVLAACVAIGVRWGPTGVAYGHVAATYSVFVPFLWWAFRDTPIDLTLWIETIIVPAVASVAMVGGIYVTREFVRIGHPAGELALSLVVGGFYYVAVLLAFPSGRSILAELLPEIFSTFRRMLPASEAGVA